MLKLTVVILAILIMWQFLTAIGRSLIPYEVFARVHLWGGLLLTLFAALHLYLNWNWVKANLLKKTKINKRS
ncbi:MAG: hypothetical protein N2246_06845 [Candidatus Sumerlaeia bacterium]|nr:hypothetical protein [Candidatus Sumerlaeia bacterium]